MGDRRISNLHDGLTIGEMLRIGIKAYACCSRCGCQKAINLVDLIEKKGRGFSLFNRRNRPCKMLPGCEGFNYFATDRWGGIITPFRDDETGHRWILEAIGERQARDAQDPNPATPHSKP